MTKADELREALKASAFPLTSKQQTSAAATICDTLGITREMVAEVMESWQVVYRVARGERAEEPKSIYGRHLYDVVQTNKRAERALNALLDLAGR